MRWIVRLRTAAIFMLKTAIFDTLGQFSQKLSDNFFSNLGKWTTIMTPLYSANAMLTESLLHGAVPGAWDLEIFGQKHKIFPYPKKAVSFGQNDVWNQECMKWRTIGPKRMLIRIMIRIWCDFEN